MVSDGGTDIRTPRLPGSDKMIIFTGSSTTDDAIQTGVAITVSVLLLLLVAVLLCIFKQRRVKMRRAANVTKTDENSTYGDYFDPDQKMEVEDTNAYYSSDYEAGTSRTTDNNPYYE